MAGQDSDGAIQSLEEGVPEVQADEHHSENMEQSLENEDQMDRDADGGSTDEHSLSDNGHVMTTGEEVLGFQEYGDAANDATDEDLLANIDEIIDQLLRSPCKQCGGTDFANIVDEHDKQAGILARQCTNRDCAHLVGVDDTMSIFDIRSQHRSAGYLGSQFGDVDLDVDESQKSGEAAYRGRDENLMSMFGDIEADTKQLADLLQNGQAVDGVIDELLSSGIDDIECGGSCLATIEEVDKERGMLARQCTDGDQDRRNDPIVHDHPESSRDSDENAPFSNIVCETCGNVDDFHTERDDDGRIKYIVCNKTRPSGRRCNNRFVPYFGISGEDPSQTDQTFPSPKTQIRDPLELQMGDHIAFHRLTGFWHHGIVLEGGKNRIKVIHYSLENDATMKDVFFSRGKIIEEWKDVDPKTEEVYRFDYNLENCFPPEDVVRRAKSRLGEDNYRLLTNNCEHFARWCKTGKESSSQIQILKDYIISHVKGPGVLLVRDLNKAKIQWEKGHISETEFIKTVVKRVARAILSGLGVAGVGGGCFLLGVTGGVVLFPFVVAIALVGVPSAYIILSAIGLVIGRKLTELI